MRRAIAIGATLAMLYVGGYVAMRVRWSNTSRFAFFGDGIDRSRWTPPRATVVEGGRGWRCVAYAFLPLIVLDTWTTSRPFVLFDLGGDRWDMMYVVRLDPPPAFPWIRLHGR